MDLPVIQKNNHYTIVSKINNMLKSLTCTYFSMSHTYLKHNFFFRINNLNPLFSVDWLSPDSSGELKHVTERVYNKYMTLVTSTNTHKRKIK